MAAWPAGIVMEPGTVAAAGLLLVRVMTRSGPLALSRLTVALATPPDSEMASSAMRMRMSEGQPSTVTVKLQLSVLPAPSVTR